MNEKMTLKCWTFSQRSDVSSQVTMVIGCRIGGCEWSSTDQRSGVKIGRTRLLDVGRHQVTTLRRIGDG